MPPTDSSELGNALRSAREAQGISQRKLGKLSGVDYSVISRIENGARITPDAHSLARLARALEIDVENFYALAGYLPPAGLPELVPYMRAKYDMPNEAAQELQRYAERLKKRYGSKTEGRKSQAKGGRHGDPAG